LSSSSSSEILIRKLQQISELREADLAILRGIAIQEKAFQSNHNLVLEGDKPSQSFVVLDGLVGSTKYTGEGKRQITSFFVTGDIPDLHGLHLSVMDCTFSTLTPSRIGFMRHDTLRAICEQHPRIATALWRSTLIDAAIYREWVTNVGRREPSPAWLTSCANSSVACVRQGASRTTWPTFLSPRQRLVMPWACRRCT